MNFSTRGSIDGKMFPGGKRNAVDVKMLPDGKMSLDGKKLPEGKKAKRFPTKTLVGQLLLMALCYNC